MEMKWSRPTCFGSRARTEEFRAFENSEDLARKKNLNYLSPFLDGNTGPIKVEGECTSEVFQKKQRTSYLTSSTVACRLADSRHPRKAASHRKRPGSYSFKTSIWLIQGRSTIKKVINRCRICRHFKQLNFLPCELCHLPLSHTQEITSLDPCMPQSNRKKLGRCTFAFSLAVRLQLFIWSSLIT